VREALLKKMKKAETAVEMEQRINSSELKMPK
jgi:hypothetical protein